MVSEKLLIESALGYAAAVALASLTASMATCAITLCVMALGYCKLDPSPAWLWRWLVLSMLGVLVLGLPWLAMYGWRITQ